MGSLRPGTDSAVADWFRERLLADHGVGSLVPTGFEAYIRIMHPAEGISGRRYTWAQIAEAHGRIPHRLMQWQAITGHWDRSCSHLDGVSEPDSIHFPLDQLDQLVRLLRQATTTPDHVFFGVWEGLGGLDETRWPGIARQTIHAGRTYLLFEGSVEAAVEELVTGGPFRLRDKHVWWPADRAWCVVTEIDFGWTYVAGTAEVMDWIRQSNFEAYEASTADRCDFFADEINPSPPQPG